MRVTGFILLTIGILYLLGALAGGYNPIGGILWTIIGGYLVSRANKNKREKEDRDKWINGGS